MAKRRILKGIPLPSPFCQSFKMGHNVHWMQARNNQRRRRYSATVSLVDSTSLIVTWLEESKQFHNHCIAGIAQALDQNTDGVVEFNPVGKLLYIKATSDDPELDSFYVAYLSEEPVSECTYPEVERSMA
jgi:hypothetical protein